MAATRLPRRRPRLAIAIHAFRVALVAALLLAIPSPVATTVSDGSVPPPLSLVQRVLPDASATNPPASGEFPEAPCDETICSIVVPDWDGQPTQVQVPLPGLSLNPVVCHFTPRPTLLPPTVHSTHPPPPFLRNLPLRC